MGEFANKLWVKILAWLIALTIVTLNAKLVIETLSEWISASEDPTIYYFLVVPLVVGAGILLLYITFAPIIKSVKQKVTYAPDGLPRDLEITNTQKYNRIAITVDFSSSDSRAISSAFAQGGKNAEYILIHIVETAGARMMGHEIDDLETLSDKSNLEKYKSDLEAQGYLIEIKLGFGNPKKSIPDIVNNCDCDLLVMGAHGHRALKDLLFGTTLDEVRHNVKVPVLIVK